MLRLLRLKDFSLVWGAGVLSILGTWVLLAALPFYMYQQTGSALATGTMFLAGAIPMVLFGLVGGAVADRFNRRRVMVASDLIRAFLILTLLMLLVVKSVWPIYVVEFLESAASLAFSPAQSALLPKIVPSESLVRANSLWRVSDNFARLLGPSIGGALLALGGLGPVIVVDVVSYLLSAALIARVSAAVGQIQPDKAKAAAPLCSLYANVAVGARMVLRQSWLVRLAVTNSLALLSQGILNVLLVIFVHDVLHAGAAGFGEVLSAQGIGGLVGCLVLTGVPNVTERLRPSRMFPLSLLAVSMIQILLFLFPSLSTAIVLLAVVGLPVTAWLASYPTLIQLGTSDQLRGRVFGVMQTIQSVSLLVSEGLTGLLQRSVGTMPLLYACAGLMALGGMVSLGIRPQRAEDPAAPPEPAGSVELDHR